MFRNFKGHKMEEFYTAKYIKAGGLYETPPISIIKGLYNEVDEHAHYRILFKGIINVRCCKPCLDINKLLDVIK
jgi:hypothetical protein